MSRLRITLGAILLASACGGGTAAPPAHSPSALAGALTQGLVAFAYDQGIGVLDPASGKAVPVTPLPPGAFRVGGPVWAPAPDLDHPVLYFTVHDERPPETRTGAPGVVPWDWLFRVDPFAGTVEPIAASQDSSSEGPFGLTANNHYLALTSGCCSTYEVDALDLQQAAPAMKALAKPPAQVAFFTEGAVPGDSGLIAVRAVGTGGWYWLNAEAGVLNPFPLSLGPDDGPIAISADGTMVAVANPDHGATIEPINSALPVASPSPSPGASSSAAPASPKSTPSAAPHHVNSKLPHPDGLAWSPDARHLALAVNGELEIYSSTAPDGTAPAARYMGGANVAGVSWSGAIEGKTLAMVKASPGPQSTVDALLAATQLPSAADTPANRPFTRIYVWQFDSTKTSPVESIADATPDVLARYPPLNAVVVLHHWAPTDTWALLGGCYRYRVVVTGSIPVAASTIGLTGGALCSAKPSPAASLRPSPSHS